VEAEALYRKALEAYGEDPMLLYNLGVLLEDLGRGKEALARYQRRSPGIRHLPTATTTLRCCTRGSGARRKQSGTSRNTAA
jgi:hypothetical protein